MAKRRIIGVQFDPEEIKRSTKIQLDPETLESLFPKKTGKNYYDYIKDFLQSDELYEKIWDDINTLIHDSLSDKEKNLCPCNDPKRKTVIQYNEKACATQGANFHFVYYLSGNDFVRTVLNHKAIYENKVALKELTINYFKCFNFLPKAVYFDFDKLAKYSLNANFKALSNIFKGFETLKYIKGIDYTIDSLQETDIENELFEKEDENFVKLQLKFLKSKRIYLNNKLQTAELEGKNLNVNKIIQNSNLRPNRTDLAYFIYYLEATKTRIIESEFPSDKAWKEIGDKFEKNWKNIQKTYNVIVREKERFKNRRDNNLLYVIENMLTEYPKALKLAKDELKLAQLNS